VFDLGRFGIQIVASPRHADGLLITGPVTHNMQLALRKTYDAVPDPKIVVAVGACAISGGPYVGHPDGWSYRPLSSSGSSFTWARMASRIVQLHAGLGTTTVRAASSGAVRASKR
jgi:hypothetical protein